MDTKYYICDYGVFYEGQILDRYFTEKGVLVFGGNVILEKFIVHYSKTTKEPILYFRIGNKYNKIKYTINCNQLGILYKKSRN